MGHLLYLLVWNFKGKIPKPLGPVVWMQCARGRLCFTPYWSLLLLPRKSSCLSKKSGGIFLWFKTLQLLLQQYKTTVKTLIMPNGTMISTLDPKLTFQKVPGIAYLILSLMLSFAALIPASQHWYATDALVRHQAPRCLNPSPPNTRDVPAFPGPTLLTCCSWGAGVRGRQTAGMAQQDHTLELLLQQCSSKQQVLSFCGIWKCGVPLPA